MSLWFREEIQTLSWQAVLTPSIITSLVKGKSFMSVGLNVPHNVLAIEGVRLASAAAGIRYQGRDDLVLLEIDARANAAAIFTQNKFRAAPVNLAIEHLGNAVPRYLVVNAGNANAGTGQAGIDAALQTVDDVAAITEVKAQQVLPFSTGVIGEVLDAEKIKVCIPNLIRNLSKDNWINAAQAIMTTDTVPKASSKEVKLGGKLIRLTGIAKGSGMIYPNMATMLAFIATDLEVEKSILEKLLHKGADNSFNSITVDGDTSTNDSCVLIATGKSKLKYNDLTAADRSLFEQVLLELMQWLAQAIVRDGEGASKFVHVQVCEASTLMQASAVAFSVANSPLVKTALAASDANWGRIMAAVGYVQDQELQLSQASLSINGIAIWQCGELAPGYSEQAGETAMSSDDIHIKVSLGLGSAEKSVWTTDLTHEYVRINAEYRT